MIEYFVAINANRISKMFDVALKSAGAQVVLATSSDANYPPENIIDGYLPLLFTFTLLIIELMSEIMRDE